MNALDMSVRNVFRYKRRSLITAAAIAFGVMATIAMDGLLIGTERESARNIRDYETGDIKIYPQNYFSDRAELPFDRFLEADDRVAAAQTLGGLGYDAFGGTVFYGSVIRRSRVDHRNAYRRRS